MPSVAVRRWPAEGSGETPDEDGVASGVRSDVAISGGGGVRSGSEYSRWGLGVDEIARVSTAFRPPRPCFPVLVSIGALSPVVHDVHGFGEDGEEGSPSVQRGGEVSPSSGIPPPQQSSTLPGRRIRLASFTLTLVAGWEFKRE